MVNIHQALNRVGAKKPRRFGKIDLSQCYWQFWLWWWCQQFTTFCTFLGNFKFTRVTMGLKCAGNFVQRTMTTIILLGLVYLICEVYMDDVLVYGETDHDFLQNLRSVFDRFRKYRIVIKPDKCQLGLAEIEFVGHTISSEGVTFSREKIQEVVEFRKPTELKDLRSFVGLVNYLRDNVRGCSLLLDPLMQMVTAATNRRDKTVVWTEQGERAFCQIKQAVNDLPVLWFLRDEYPIYLYTDASERGIGGYLYQWAEDHQVPIRFFSKAFSGAQRNWSAVEKECYALVASVKKFEDLLNGVPFIIRTDHRNLKYLNITGSPKVARWKLELGRFDCVIEHVPGVDNVMADYLSRNFPPLVRGTTPEMILGNVVEPLYTVEQARVLETYHGTLAGHFGARRTYTRMSANGVKWPNLKDIVVQYVRNCPCCQRMTCLESAITATSFHTFALRPWEKVCIDTIGPFEADALGNTYMTAIIDAMSRAIQLYPTKDNDGASAAQALDLCGMRFGYPQVISSDRGREFVNELIAALTKLRGVDHSLTCAYSKEEAGLIERSNKETVRHLSNIIFDRRIKGAWSDARVIGHVEQLMNNSPNRNTGLAPYRILFGAAYNPEQGLLPAQADVRPVVESMRNPSYRAYIDKLLKEQWDIIDAANRSQLAASEKRITRRYKTIVEQQQAVDKKIVKKSARRARHKTPEEIDESFILVAPNNPGRGLPSVVSNPQDPKWVRLGPRKWVQEQLRVDTQEPTSSSSTPEAVTVDDVEAPDGEETHETRWHDLVNFTCYKEGDLVLRNYPANLLRRKPSKLHPFWQGPYRVDKRAGDHYDLRNLVTHELEPVVHVSRLKPFEYDARIVDPIQVASNNTDDEFLVEAVLDHRVVGTDPIELQWEVKWAGEEETTWASTRSIEKVEQFHQYCRGNPKLIRYIPHQFREQYGLLRRQRKPVVLNERAELEGEISVSRVLDPSPRLIRVTRRQKGALVHDDE
jgi:hypothetical protein